MNPTLSVDTLWRLYENHVYIFKTSFPVTKRILFKNIYTLFNYALNYLSVSENRIKISHLVCF